jgi:hypothetical protein
VRRERERERESTPCEACESSAIPNPRSHAPTAAAEFFHSTRIPLSLSRAPPPRAVLQFSNAICDLELGHRDETLACRYIGGLNFSRPSVAASFAAHCAIRRGGAPSSNYDHNHGENRPRNRPWHAIFLSGSRRSLHRPEEETFREKPSRLSIRDRLRLLDDHESARTSSPLMSVLREKTRSNNKWAKLARDHYRARTIVAFERAVLRSAGRTITTRRNVMITTRYQSRRVLVFRKVAVADSRRRK